MKFGIEKEALMFDNNLGPKNYKPNELEDGITVDFSSNQVELVSGVHNNAFELMDELYKKLNSNEIINYKMWPLSMPGICDYQTDLSFFTGEKLEYRKGLLEKYGEAKMNISGIHFNFSFTDEQNHDEETYFNLMKKLYVYLPVILQFFSFSPVYAKGMFDWDLKDIGKNVGLDNSISLRNTYKYGYMNYNQYELDFSTLDKYKKSIEDAITNKKINSKFELYLPIRLKSYMDECYLEFRFIDINPYNRLGITIDDVVFLKNIIKYISNIDVNTSNIKQNMENFETVCLEGKDKNIKINVNGKTSTLYEHTTSLLEHVLKNTIETRDQEIIKTYIKKYNDDNLDCDKLRRDLEITSVKEFGIKHLKYKESFEPIEEKSNLELSTKLLIKEAKEQNFEVNIISEDFNLVNFKKDNLDFDIIQATKTNKDGYVVVSILDNKLLTKEYLNRVNVKTPKSILLKKGENLDKINLNEFKQSKIVSKPLDTNFGKGIMILEKDASDQEIKDAISFAFGYSNYVMLEEFFEGTEYRFFVINDKVVSIIKRIPAHVIGDGHLTIKELVENKNKSKLRGEGYKKPLEKIKLGTVEEEYISRSGYDFNTVLDAGKICYLRENSNVSTGGETFEEFDMHSNYFKDIARIGVKAIGAKICGIDMIISEDYKDYTIIEANYNPAIHMHQYPLYGIGVNISQEILNLFTKQKK